MNKVSAIVKSQAHNQFAQKRQQVISSTLEKNKHNHKDFKEILDVFMNSKH
jgi:hypothetical protein